MAGETRAPELIASVAIFLPIALTAVAVRLWVRARMIRNMGWDDAMMVLALANFIVYCSAIMIIVAHGGGTRRSHLLNIRLGIVWTLVAEISYLTSILFLKVSLGLFFLRIVQVKWQRKVIYGVIIMSTLVQSYHAFLLLFACGNPKHYPEHMLLSKCIPKHIQVDLAYSQGAVTTLTDFIFALLPIPLLWNTTLDMRSKLSVAFVLILGTSGCVCSLVRFKYIAGLGELEEFFWTAANISLWSLYEIATGIIAGSLATMRPLYSKVAYKARTITQVAGRVRKDSRSNGQGSRARMLSRKQSYASSVSRSQKTITDWTKTVDAHQTYTTTCFAGPDYDYAEGLKDNEELANMRGGKLSRKPSSDENRVWPFTDDQSIHKTVQIEVRSSQEEEQPWAGAGSGKWSQRMEDLLKTPPRIRKGSRDDDSIPEWDRLPDLIPPSRKGSSDSQRIQHNESRSPPLVRIVTR